MSARFVQLHTLTSYPASLLNRDDVGFAKRIPFGGADRVRISSQCLKRHWRTTEHEHSLAGIRLDNEPVPMSIRSRRTFQLFVYEALTATGTDAAVAEAVTEEMIDTLLPKAKAKSTAKDGEKPESLRTSQVTVLGRPEVRYLLGLAREAAEGAKDAKAARKAWKERSRGELKKNLAELRLGAGLDAALFGRMVTGDILARCDAAIHVAHAFTVDAGGFETDYFSAVDDLQAHDETGSGHINNSELTTGLFYGYVVVDVPLLVSNLEGCDRAAWLEADRELAAEVVRRLIHTVATVSPGAKQGATAPYARALTLMAETGRSQPRTLANAFLDAVTGRDGLLERAQLSLSQHLQGLDRMYGRDTSRRLAAVTAPPGLVEAVDEQTDLPTLAQWVSQQIQEAH